MKLATWTLYNAKKMRSVDDKVILEGSFPFLLVRPDPNKPNQHLGLGIEAKYFASIVSDLINREMPNQMLYDVFKNKLGIVETKDLDVLSIKKQSWSDKPINVSNIQNLIDIFNILVKSESINFDSEEFSSIEKIKADQKDPFMEFNIKTMTMQRIVNAINVGLPDFYTKLKDLTQDMPNEVRMTKLNSFSILQTNLILFFEEATKRMDQLIQEQNKIIDELEKKDKNDKK
ncbi:hypothetical protein [Williamsoniiplasma luminosum]|uniref:Uncharacterized protein n=1 Tax=Williamsoniiplasma luminosum TaxID=214888 RepID=A0A2S0NKW8_9MOLU|nr:hypothetical protein [Williamsoniiplasma luminosum]AVP49654.1 MAG: hypothetical protein C5T88_03710 [Williamsoniiplasma luminosum]